MPQRKEDTDGKQEERGNLSQIERVGNRIPDADPGSRGMWKSCIWLCIRRQRLRYPANLRISDGTVLKSLITEGFHQGDGGRSRHQRMGAKAYLITCCKVQRHVLGVGTVPCDPGPSQVYGTAKKHRTSVLCGKANPLREQGNAPVVPEGSNIRKEAGKELPRYHENRHAGYLYDAVPYGATGRYRDVNQSDCAARHAGRRRVQETAGAMQKRP